MVSDLPLTINKANAEGMARPDCGGIRPESRDVASIFSNWFERRARVGRDQSISNEPFDPEKTNEPHLPGTGEGVCASRPHQNAGPPVRTSDPARPEKTH